MSAEVPSFPFSRANHQALEQWRLAHASNGIRRMYMLTAGFNGDEFECELFGEPGGLHPQSVKGQGSDFDHAIQSALRQWRKECKRLGGVA